MIKNRSTGFRRAVLTVAILAGSGLASAALPPSAHAEVSLSEAPQIVTLPAPIVSVYGNSSAAYPGPSAGGPGPAQGVSAVSSACNGGAALHDAQWYSLPEGDLDTAWAVENGSYREDPDMVPAKFAFVNASTLAVVSCDDGPTAVAAGIPLLLATWFTDPVAPCDPDEWSVCDDQYVNYTVHRVAREEPANDDWEHAVPIGALPFTATVDTSRATQDGPLRADWSRCLPWAVDLVETADVWFSYTAPSDGTLRISAGSSVPGYTPEVGFTAMLPDGGGPQPPDPDAELDDCFPPATVTAGRTYLIYVQNRYDSYNGEPYPVGGPVTLNVTLDGAPSLLGPPREVRITPGADGSATLTWTPAHGDLADGVTGYRLHRGGPSPVTLDVGSSETSHTFTGLAGWQLYDFSVEALRGTTVGPAGSAIAYLPARTPSVPLSPVASPGNASATISWKPPTHDGLSSVSGYRLRRIATSDGALKQTVTVPASATSYTFTSLTNGTGYRFDVAALNDHGTGAVSAMSKTVTPAGPPSRPVGVTVTRDEVVKSATLRWSPPAWTGGRPVTGYLVTRDGQDVHGNGPVTTTVSAPTCSFTFKDLVPGTKYRLTVAAVTEAATGLTAPLPVTLTTPGLPLDVTASAGDTTVTVTWTAPTHAGSAPITGYRLRRFVGTSSTVAQNLTVPADSTSYTFTGLKNGSSYSFDVTAKNVTGKGPASARTPAVTPRAS